MNDNIKARRRFLHSQAGFSLLEMLVTLGIAGVLGSMAVFSFRQAEPYFKGDGGMRVLQAQFITARELAIAQRRNMRLTFTNTNQVNIVREEVFPPNTTTVVGDVLFEGGMTFGLVAGVPDTPEAFGNPTPVAFGAAAIVMFTPEGMLVDQATGNPINGSVFIAFPGMARSERAVTVLGATGRVRAYRWDGRQWVLV